MASTDSEARQEAADGLWAAWKARGDSSVFVLVRGIVDCGHALVPGWLDALLREAWRGSSTALARQGTRAMAPAPAPAVEYHESACLIPLDGAHVPSTISMPRMQPSAYFLRASSWDYQHLFRFGRLHVSSDASIESRALDCSVTPVLVHGRVLLETLTQWALLEGSGVTGVGCLELHLGWKNFSIPLARVLSWCARPSGEAGGAWTAQADQWSSSDLLHKCAHVIDRTQRACVHTVVASLPAWCMSVHLTAGSIAAPACHSLLPAPRFTDTVLGGGAAARLWHGVAQVFCDCFTPGGCFVTELHPSELVHVIKVCPLRACTAWHACALRALCEPCAAPPNGRQAARC